MYKYAEEKNRDEEVKAFSFSCHKVLIIVPKQKNKLVPWKNK